MSLSEAQWRTLEQVCRTIVPDAPRSLARDVVETLATSGNPADLAQFRQALTLLESPIAGLLLHGRASHFSQLDTADRETVLRRWATHPLPLMRQAFQAFKRIVGFLYSSDPANSLWERLGYPGRDDRPAAGTSLKVRTWAGEAALDADAVVIGSGAGGGVVAAELASRGLHVLVLEKGGHFPEAQLGAQERDGMQNLYLDRGMTATRDLSVAILAGSAVGGGTLVNWTACIAPPDWLRSEWEHEFGLSGLSSSAFQSCVDDVMTRLGVNYESSHSLPASSAGKLLDGCKALGYQASELPRNVIGCGEDCGFCTFGCRTGAKQSAARTYLIDAVEHGAHVIPRADVRRVRCAAGQVTGVEAIIDGVPVTIRTPRVIMSAGAIGSPAILLRSGLANRNIGQNLHLHPVAAVVGTYPEAMYPWSGRLLPAYSSQFARIDGNYGFLLEVAPAHPGLGGLSTPWASGAQYAADLDSLKHAGVFIALVRDKGSGQLTVDREGRHRIDYRVSPFDKNHLLHGQAEAIRVHNAAGAGRVMTLHAGLNVLEDTTPAGAAEFANRSKSLPNGPNELFVFSAHQMGTCRMGPSPADAVADPTGAVFGVRGLYVADASAFPAASGVNPMITTMSLARWVAKQIA